MSWDSLYRSLVNFNCQLDITWTHLEENLNEELSGIAMLASLWAIFLTELTEVGKPTLDVSDVVVPSQGLGLGGCKCRAVAYGPDPREQRGPHQLLCKRTLSLGLASVHQWEEWVLKARQDFRESTVSWWIHFPPIVWHKVIKPSQQHCFSRARMLLLL